LFQRDKSLHMKHKAAKIGLTTVVLALAFAGLMFSTMGAAAEYYLHVDEVMGQPEQWYGKRLQLHGFAKQVTRKEKSLEYRFQVESKGHVVTATYKGVVPDTFKDDAEVVLKGTLSPDGFVVAPNGVMAKCPSKYEPQGIAGSPGT
jgi:cytochrome c-type biogenesis protein CcmE